jgi:crotonobetainyl-CoA:carnitine CoA-transferase CaiB-like acyl-CoA transferase
MGGPDRRPGRSAHKERTLARRLCGWLGCGFRRDGRNLGPELGIQAPRQPQSGHPAIVLFQFFKAAAGYVAVECAKERFFRLLAPAIGLPELVDDERFHSCDTRLADRTESIAILSETFRQRRTGEWRQAVRGKVPIASVRSLADALSPEEPSERGMLAQYEHPVLGQVQSIGSPAFLKGCDPWYRAAPALGGDRDDIPLSLGYTADAINDLAGAGAFGDPSEGRQTIG